mgnify:CR=1 FL=1
MKHIITYNGKTYVTEYATYFLEGGSISYSYSWNSLDNTDDFPVNEEPLVIVKL